MPGWKVKVTVVGSLYPVNLSQAFCCCSSVMGDGVRGRTKIIRKAGMERWE